MSFDIQKEVKDSKTYLKFSGYVDEESSFPIFNDLSGEVFVNLEEVKSINSVGIRSWIKWFSSFSNVQFTFQACPKSIVMQMNMVEGFLPESASVESIQVPFYSEANDEEFEALFYVGKEIVLEGDSVRLEYKKEEIYPAGGEIELDVSETKYFKFLFKVNNKQAAA
ncbi:MAG: hypothetical protein HRT44_04980 [Bdellovibrionales bacterium]|nr:hypothetical protein [Bdellovibrionales bacterium]NQZ18595.1 hypothetical protein [Bdellovibrionales bacterium]